MPHKEISFNNLCPCCECFGGMCCNANQSNINNNLTAKDIPKFEQISNAPNFQNYRPQMAQPQFNQNQNVSIPNPNLDFEDDEDYDDSMYIDDVIDGIRKDIKRQKQTFYSENPLDEILDSINRLYKSATSIDKDLISYEELDCDEEFKDERVNLVDATGCLEENSQNCPRKDLAINKLRDINGLIHEYNQSSRLMTKILLETIQESLKVKPIQSWDSIDQSTIDERMENVATNLGGIVHEMVEMVKIVDKYTESLFKIMNAIKFDVNFKKYKKDTEKSLRSERDCDI